MSVQESVSLTSPNVTYFPIPSLYTALQDEDVQRLEHCCALGLTGIPAEAEEAWTALPGQLKIHSVYLIGRTTNLLYQRNFRTAYALLVEVTRENLLQGRTVEETLLVRSLFAYVAIVFKGSFVLAKECMLELRSLFSQTHLEEYTDGKVRARCSCVEARSIFSRTHRSICSETTSDSSKKPTMPLPPSINALGWMSSSRVKEDVCGV